MKHYNKRERLVEEEEKAELVKKAKQSLLYPKQTDV
jgi:hypothetical protein